MRRQKRERKRQEKREKGATDFKEAACYPSAVVQRTARRKNGLCEGSTRGSWDSHEGQQPFRPNPNEVGDSTITLKWLLIGAIQFCSLYTAYCIYDRNFALHHLERLELIRVVGTDKWSVMTIRVTFNSKSELVEDREGKSALYREI